MYWLKICQLMILNIYYKNLVAILLKLVKQKRVYPYEYMDSFKRFSEDKLPYRCKLFSFLEDECISEKDFSHAINVCNTFKINAMGYYGNLCLKTDVSVLADVFEKFINPFGANVPI